MATSTYSASYEIIFASCALLEIYCLRGVGTEQLDPRVGNAF